MGIILTVVATLLIGLELAISHLAERKKYKWVLVLTFGLLSILSIWGAYILQQNDAEQSEVRIQSQSELLTGIRDSLAQRDEDIIEIKTQNDSLQRIIKKYNQMQESILRFTQSSANELSEGSKAMKQLLTNNVSRKLSLGDRNTLLSLLKLHKGQKIIINSIMGDSESLQFAFQFENVFKEAGWVVESTQGLYGIPMPGILLSIKSDKYPSIVDTLYKYLTLIGLKVKGNRDKDLNDGDFKLVIGTRE